MEIHQSVIENLKVLLMRTLLDIILKHLIIKKKKKILNVQRKIINKQVIRKLRLLLEKAKMSYPRVMLTLKLHWRIIPHIKIKTKIKNLNKLQDL